MASEDKPSPRRRRAILLHSLWLIFGIALGVVLGPPLQQGVDWARWHVGNRTITGSPDCSDPGWYRELLTRDASAFHEFRDKYGTYSAEDTTDGSPRTAWVAELVDKPDQDWIGWKLTRSRQIRLICIRTGFTRTYGTYAGNGRPKTVQLIGCGGTSQLTFPDHVNLQTRTLDENYRDYVSIPISCTTDHVRLQIDSTYAANDHSHVVAISDVRFYGSWRLTTD